MNPNEQTEFPPALVAAVNEAWKRDRCDCYADSAVCVTCTSVSVLRELRDGGWLRWTT